MFFWWVFYFEHNGTSPPPHTHTYKKELKISKWAPWQNVLAGTFILNTMVRAPLTHTYKNELKISKWAPWQNVGGGDFYFEHNSKSPPTHTHTHTKMNSKSLNGLPEKMFGMGTFILNTMVRAHTPTPTHTHTKMNSKSLNGLPGKTLGGEFYFEHNGTPPRRHTHTKNELKISK